MGKQTFLKIRKFSGSFHYLKSENFLGMRVRKWQIFINNLQIKSTNFLQNTTQLCLKIVQEVAFLLDFLLCTNLIRALYAIFVRRKSMYLRTCGSFQSANHKKIVSANRISASVAFAEGLQM